MKKVSFKKRSIERLKTTQQQYTRNKVNSFFKTLLLSTLIILAIAITFLHDYFPNVSREFLDHKKTYKTIIDNRNAAFDKLLTQLEKKNITIEEFVISYKKAKKKSSLELKKFHKIKKKLIVENSYLGYTSFKNFLLGIGFPICGLILSLLFLNIVINPIHQKYLKKFYLVVSFAFIVCWGYWVSWSFLWFSQDPNRPFDFPKSYYNIALYILPIVLSISAYYLMKYYTSIEEKLKRILKPFFDFFYKDAEEKDLIRPEKMKEFDKITIELTEHAATNE